MFQRNAVYVVDGCRTPYLMATGSAGAYCAAYRAAGVGSRVGAR